MFKENNKYYISTQGLSCYSNAIKEFVKMNALRKDPDWDRYEIQTKIALVLPGKKYE